MKILAKAEKDTFLVEMHVGEIARAAGFASAYGDLWWKHIGGTELKIGTVIDCNAAYTYYHRVLQFQKEAGSAANTLRALADLIGGALPDVVLPPIEPIKPDAKTEGGDA